MLCPDRVVPHSRRREKINPVWVYCTLLEWCSFQRGRNVVTLVRIRKGGNRPAEAARAFAETQVAKYQKIGGGRTKHVVLDKWQKMITRNWVEISHGNHMATEAQVRRNVKVRSRRHDRSPSRMYSIFSFRCIFCPELQRTLWSILRIRILLCRFAFP